MAKGFGNNVMLWVETATPGTFALVKGQANLSRSGGSTKFSTATKDTAGYETQGFGLKSWGAKMDVVPDLPDANGYTRLETLCLASPAAPFNIQLRKNGVAGAAGDVIFAASVYGDLSDQSFNQNEPVKASFEFVLAGAPSVDQLAN